ncbi:MAG: hypothetical protein MUE40_17510 [Anaerolineae bacterium]|nr:hypothetical protein [Anaerolineae bacterium]
MSRLFYRIGGMLALLLTTAILSVSAHEGREVGEFNLVFGWREEPAFAGMMNGPEIILEAGHGEEHGDDHGGGHSDTDAAADEHSTFDWSSIEVNLQAEVTFGDQTTTVNFRRAWGTENHYIAELIPTLPGDYTFRVYGTIGDIAVEEIFSSADGQFSTVEPAGDIMFPALPAVDNSRIAALEARIAALEALLAEMSSGE